MCGACNGVVGVGSTWSNRIAHVCLESSLGVCCISPVISLSFVSTGDKKSGEDNQSLRSGGIGWMW
jgi:hypothetical protein